MRCGEINSFPMCGGWKCYFDWTIDLYMILPVIQQENRIVVCAFVLLIKTKKIH